MNPTIVKERMLVIPGDLDPDHRDLHENITSRVSRPRTKPLFFVDYDPDLGFGIDP